MYQQRIEQRIEQRIDGTLPLNGCANAYERRIEQRFGRRHRFLCSAEAPDN